MSRKGAARRLQKQHTAEIESSSQIGGGVGESVTAGRSMTVSAPFHYTSKRLSKTGQAKERPPAMLIAKLLSSIDFEPQVHTSQEPVQLAAEDGRSGQPESNPVICRRLKAEYLSHPPVP